MPAFAVTWLVLHFSISVHASGAKYEAWEMIVFSSAKAVNLVVLNVYGYSVDSELVRNNLRW